jgi:hypothetical protein
MNEYVISVQRVSDHRLAYTWMPNPFPTVPNTFWVEYPFDVSRIMGQDIFYPVLPLFLALGFANSRFRLVSQIPDQSATSNANTVFQQVLANWLEVVATEALGNFGKRIHVDADIDGQIIEPTTVGQISTHTSQSGTALFLGGGAESLLALGELREQNIKPHLISYLGPGWIGSDPAKNETKVAQDQRIAQELGLELHHVHTDVYGLFVQMQNALWEHMATDAFFVNCVLFTPILTSLFAPLVNIYGLGAVYHGHEKHLEPDPTFHCFTKTFTDKLAHCFAPQFAYRRVLWDLHKVDVFEKLSTKHAALLKYQYSCYNNEHERWCFRCEKCLRYYILFKLFEVPFDVVGFDEARMLENFGRIHAEIASHVWCDPFARAMYNGIVSAARSRGNKDVLAFLTSLIREAKRIEAKKRAQALIRPLVPEPIKRLARSVLSVPGPDTSHA